MLRALLVVGDLPASRVSLRAPATSSTWVTWCKRNVVLVALVFAILFITHFVADAVIVTFLRYMLALKSTQDKERIQHCAHPRLVTNHCTALQSTDRLR